MTTVTRTPAQAAKAGGQGRPPATPLTRRRGPNDRANTCGAHRTTKQTGPCANIKACRLPEHHCGAGKGRGTDHPGIGRCKLHGGSTPDGKKQAARQKVELSLKSLAIPVEGDPLEALQAAVERAHGAMIGAQALVARDGTGADVELYMRTIREAARTAKAAAEAINLEELVRIREREADLLEVALMRALERSGMGTRKRADFLSVFREELSAVLPAGPELS